MKKDINKKIIIGFSIGDYNSIGPEIFLKSFSSTNLFKNCIPIIFCEESILDYYKKKFKINIKIKALENFDSIKDQKCIYTFSSKRKEIIPKPGEINKDAGNYAIKSLNECSNALVENKIDGIVTLPISKINSQSKKFKFPGHTEFFLEKFHIKENMMIMYSKLMIVGFVSGHVPFNSVKSVLDKKYIEKKFKIFAGSLKRDFNIKNPKVAILGLNPHAGEDGLLGDEEIKIINPIIKKLNKNKKTYEGPFSSDSFFGLKKFQNYDGVISWYHDQGLIGFKSFSFDDGVNFTGGMPIVRTSPDHGTAFNIAGKGISREKSLINSIKLNIEIINNRKFLK